MNDDNGAAAGPGKDATSEIDAEFVVFRVFAVAREYNDRPAAESWTWSGQRGPAAGDTTEVTVGDLTPDFTAAVRALGAWRPFVLQSMFGGLTGDTSAEGLEATFEDLLPDVEAAVEEFKKPAHIHITVTLRRPVRAQAFDGRVHRWLANTEPLEDIGKFMEEAGAYLDVTCARLMGPLGELAPETGVYRSNRAMLFAPGKTPLLTDFQVRAGALAGSVSGTAGRLSTGSLSPICWRRVPHRPVPASSGQPRDGSGQQPQRPTTPSGASCTRSAAWRL